MGIRNSLYNKQATRPSVHMQSSPARTPDAFQAAPQETRERCSLHDMHYLAARLSSRRPSLTPRFKLACTPPSWHSRLRPQFAALRARERSKARRGTLRPGPNLRHQTGDKDLRSQISDLGSRSTHGSQKGTHTAVRSSSIALAGAEHCAAISPSSPSSDDRLCTPGWPRVRVRSY